jgi:tRNA threonylcarbamoyl adenosine modification protein YeaZ
MIDECLARSGLGLGELDAVVVGRGPGSFTGTRIAIATAKGLALGAGLPLVAVSSLEAAAIDTGWWAGPVASILDARRGQVLFAVHALHPVEATIGGRTRTVPAARTLVEPVLLGHGDVAPALGRLEPGGGIRVIGDAIGRDGSVLGAPGVVASPASDPLIRDPLPARRTTRTRSSPSTRGRRRSTAGAIDRATTINY